MSAVIGSSWHGAAAPVPQVLSTIFNPDPAEALLGATTHGRPLDVISSDFRPPRIAVRSYQFTPGAGPKTPVAALPTPPPTDVPSSPARPRYTRVAPPEDVVGMGDRLSMLLEPPLELLLTNASLEFAAQPFPFQMQGVAFLYPRQAALLADEMGLGKTMQAITAIRLLVHTREARPRAAGLPKATGVQLATRVPHLGT